MKKNVMIKSRIFLKFSVIISLVLIVLFFVAGVIIFKLQEQSLIREKRQNSKLFSEYIADTCAPYIARKSFFNLEEITLSLQGKVNDRHEIVSFIVLDTNGRKLNPSGIDKTHIDLPKKYRLVEEKICSFPDNKGEERRVGTVIITYSLESMYNNISAMVSIYFAITVFVIVLLDGIIAALVYIIIIKPLEKITRAADKIAEGEYAISFDSLPSDEIGFLGTTLVNMGSRINSAFLHIENNKKEIQKVNENLENMVEQRTAELIHSEKMAALGQLVAGVAHEINTPIGVSVTASSHLRRETEDIVSRYESKTMKQIDFHKFIETSLETTNLLDKNLLRASELIQSFKQVAVDQSSEDRRIFNVKEYINEVLLSLRPKYRGREIEFFVNCHDDVQINSYPGYFSQIISNFVINSLIHAFSDGQCGHITFEIERSEKVLIFIYRDNGCGLPKSRTHTIFEPFYTTKRNQGGSGLGLHIVYNIVTQKMGGTIMCDSDTGKGIFFLLSIPV